MEIAFRWKKNRVGSRGAKNQLAMFIESATTTTTTKKTSSNKHGMKTRGQLSWKIRQKSSDIFFHLRKMFCQMHYIFFAGLSWLHCVARSNSKWSLYR